MVSERRNYKVINTEQAKEVTRLYLCDKLEGMDNVTFGLPEIYDRYNIWNVPILYKKEVVGEIAIDAYSKEVSKKLSSDIEILFARMQKVDEGKVVAQKKGYKKKAKYRLSDLNNMLIKGRAERVLKQLPEQSIDMIFTSPPYYNARKQYSEYNTYEDYLALIRKVVRECKRVLMDGKFFVINSSHVLIPRASRNESSSRVAVPFDIHQIFMEEGFEFVDDIIWEKPEGAGWASGRGRRFSADRNPMQYKAVPVTEYVMVYRKKPAILIDHFIRNHPEQSVIQESKIEDGYEKTNVWYISPARDKRHPAIFPKELAEKVIKYYSFKNDVVLDPFGGIGTTAKAAFELERRFVSIECSDEYMECAARDIEELNTIITPLHYEYIDYSALDEEIEDDQEYDIYETIRILEKSGITRDKMSQVLKEHFESPKKLLKRKGNMGIFEEYNDGGKNSIKATSSDFINMVGEDGLRDVVKKVLLGGNVRDVTEFITQRRLINSYSALLELYIKHMADYIDSTDVYVDYVANDLIKSRGDARMLDLWLLGLTKKGLDNIVRTEKHIVEYKYAFSDSMKDAVEDLEKTYGELSGAIEIRGQKLELNWNVLALMLMSIGAQTLSIRGSAKSMNGKMFEKLVLGTLLTTIGFTYLAEPPCQIDKTQKYFWLSNMDENEREIDATLVYDGKAISIDIGFIGKGNPEITLDKVTRFNAYKQIGGLHHDMVTIIIVDTVGENSDLFNKAAKVNGHVFQMKNSNWTIEFAKIVCEIMKTPIELAEQKVENLETYFVEKIKDIDMKKFV